MFNEYLNAVYQKKQATSKSVCRGQVVATNTTTGTFTVNLQGRGFCTVDVPYAYPEHSVSIGDWVIIFLPNNDINNASLGGFA